MKRRRDRPLAVRIHRGVLVIEIGMDTLAHSAVHSPFAYSWRNPEGEGRRPDDRFSVSDPKGFAEDVKRELLREAEDGSSRLTDLFDNAMEAAIEDGSEFFNDKDNPA